MAPRSSSSYEMPRRTRGSRGSGGSQGSLLSSIFLSEGMLDTTSGLHAPRPAAAGVEIGSGVSGVVFAATDEFCSRMVAQYGMLYGSEFAVKVYRHNEDFKDFCREVAIYMELADVPDIAPLVHWTVKMWNVSTGEMCEIQSHETYVDFNDAFDALNDKAASASGWKPVEMCQIFPLYEGPFHDVVGTLPLYSLMEKLSACKMVADAMLEMHKRQIMHNDLHPGNILYRTILDGDGGLELAIHDLGHANRVGQNSEQAPGLYMRDTSFFGEFMFHLMREHEFGLSESDIRMRVAVNELIDACYYGPIRTRIIVRCINALIFELEK